MSRWKRGDDSGGTAGPGGDPSEALEALATAETDGADTEEITRQVLNTRRFLGMTEECTVLDCDAHNDAVVSDLLNCKYGMPVVVQLGVSEEGGQCVEDLLKALVLKSNDETGAEDLSSVVLRECPLCLDSGVLHVSRTRTARHLDTGARSSFFVRVAPDRDCTTGCGLSPSHSVHMFGAEYQLCAVIYRIAAGGHYVCQLYLDGSWYYYNDLQRGGRLECKQWFDADLHRGSEYIYMFIRSDLVSGAQTRHRQKALSNNVHADSGASSRGTGRSTEAGVDAVVSPSLEAGATPSSTRSAASSSSGGGNLTTGSATGVEDERMGAVDSCSFQDDSDVAGSGGGDEPGGQTVQGAQEQVRRSLRNMNEQHSRNIKRSNTVTFKTPAGFSIIALAPLRMQLALVPFTARYTLGSAILLGGFVLSLFRVGFAHGSLKSREEITK